MGSETRRQGRSRGRGRQLLELRCTGRCPTQDVPHPCILVGTREPRAPKHTPQMEESCGLTRLKGVIQGPVISMSSSGVQSRLSARSRQDLQESLALGTGPLTVSADSDNTHTHAPLLGGLFPGLLLFPGPWGRCERRLGPERSARQGPCSPQARSTHQPEPRPKPEHQRPTGPSSR